MGFHYRLLLVEDEPIIAKITARTLSQVSEDRYDITVCTTNAEANNLLDQNDYDVILLDLNLPDTSGLDTIRAILASHRDVPIVVLTANTNDKIGLSAIQVGAQDFLIKGKYDPSLIQRTIRFAIERHRLQATVAQLAIIDELTNLYNRRGFTSLAQGVIDEVVSSELSGFICYFDLDHFKAINDQFGHKAGDYALTDFASLLQIAFRKNVLLVRMGGDEFLAMGCKTEFSDAGSSIERMNELLEVRNGETQGEPIHFSVGRVFFDHTYTGSIEDLLSQADHALYAEKDAKRKKRNQIAS